MFYIHENRIDDCVGFELFSLSLYGALLSMILRVERDLDLRSHNAVLNVLDALNILF